MLPFKTHSARNAAIQQSLDKLCIPACHMQLNLLTDSFHYHKDNQVSPFYFGHRNTQRADDILRRKKQVDQKAACMKCFPHLSKALQTHLVNHFVFYHGPYTTRQHSKTVMQKQSFHTTDKIRRYRNTHTRHGTNLTAHFLHV